MAVSFATAQANYLDNADYRADGSVLKAQAFATACLQLIGFAQQAGRNSASATMNLPLIDQQRRDAEKFIAQNSTTSQAGIGTTVSHPNFAGFRD